MRATPDVSSHALVTPYRALGVASWATPSGVELDLRYAPDEAAFLELDMADTWERIIHSHDRSGAEVVGHYPVDDRYGGRRGAPVLSEFFGERFAEEQVTFGAGVTGLLHGLSGLASGGPVLAPAATHPDVEVWAHARGSQIHVLDRPAGASNLASEVARLRPAVVHVDRPDFFGHTLSLDEMETLTRAAARVGACVLVDESAAPYLATRASAACLVPRVDNLVVCRGFTKGYSWGGLRVGYAIASCAMTHRVRDLVPPMQVGELSLFAALALLQAGDIFGELRRRVRAVKPLAAGRVAACGITVQPNGEDLPWLALEDPGGRASHYLEARGIYALRPAPNGFATSGGDALRMTVPLSRERIARFEQLLA